MGAGVFDPDRASVNDHATGIHDAQAGFLLLLCSNQSGRKGKSKGANWMYLELHECVWHLVLVELDFDVAFAKCFHGFCNRELQLINGTLTRQANASHQPTYECSE
jgi:hypothetical protein